MRQLVTLPDAQMARLFTDYLLTLQIHSKLEQEPDGWVIWVRDEDELPRARQELEEFNRNPSDPRYAGVSHVAGNLRRQKARDDAAYHRRQDRFYARMGRAGAVGGCTLALIVVSSLVSLMSEGGRSNSRLVQALSIAPYKYVPVMKNPSNIPWDEEEPIEWKLQCDEGLQPILHGQIWRLVTPIFIHMNIWHLFFNMWWLYVLGGAIERRRGRVRYLFMVLVLAVLSNLAQYFFGHVDRGDLFTSELRFPNFGGMSGVVYGLFGYVWMKARFQPELGLSIQARDIIIMMAWFFLCMTPLIETIIGSGVANVAHAAGLIVGMILGYVPTFWSSSTSE